MPAIRQSITPSRGSVRAGAVLGAVLGVAIAVAGGCQTRPADPLEVLSRRDVAEQRHERALAMLAEQDFEDRAVSDPAGGVDRDEAAELLSNLLWHPGYTVEVRAAALDLLEALDADRLHRTIRRELPHIDRWAWLAHVCEVIAERRWTQHTEPLLMSWARPTNLVDDERDRPEHAAIATMYGEDAVVDLLLTTLVEASSPGRHRVRVRCWEVLHRLGERSRVIELVTGTPPDSEDLMLADLRRLHDAFGLVPHNREEIIWARRLFTERYADFRIAARDVVGGLPAGRRDDLALRDLAIIVAVAEHAPSWLDLDRAAHYEAVRAALDGRRHHLRNGGRADSVLPSERLADHREALRWGDLLAIRMALAALDAPGVVSDLFDYADVDLADDGTEYGGLIVWDGGGPAVERYPPTIREHGRKFIAPPSMFDESYDALFHFHFHAQSVLNEQYAGPGLGDLRYADNVRANCLVLTFISRNRLNVDYYRHDGVVVDLGEVRRPQRSSGRRLPRRAAGSGGRMIVHDRVAFQRRASRAVRP